MLILDAVLIPIGQRKRFGVRQRLFAGEDLRPQPPAG
jgi:hypothetical protein